MPGETLTVAYYRLAFEWLWESIMGKLTVTSFVTLDGVMQAPGGPEEDRENGFSYGGWVFPYFDEGLGQHINEIFTRAGAFLLGRTTYDIFSQYWPKITDENDAVASALNHLPKYIASTTTKQFSWNNSYALEDLVATITELKKNLSAELQIHGSCGLIQSLLKGDLIDEFNVFIFPLVLGQGKRLFSQGIAPQAFKVTKTVALTKGGTYLQLQAAGEISLGSFVD